MSNDQDRLNDLCDSGELYELLALVPLDAVAATWCRYTDRSVPAGAGGMPDDDSDWWAINFFLCRAFWRDSDLQRRALLALLRATVDERVVGCIGAGPLEDFVSDNEEDLLWLEEQARENESLRIALRHVWADTASQTPRWSGSTQRPVSL